jgi:cytochrome P450 family 4
MKSPKHTTKSIIYDLYKPWLREGLLLSAGHKWNARRKLLTPAFHFKILRQHKTIMIEKSRVFRDVLAEASSSHPHGFDVCPFITRCTLDILCEAIMGVSLDAQRKPSSYATALERLTQILFYRRQVLRSGRPC